MNDNTEIEIEIIKAVESIPFEHWKVTTQNERREPLRFSCYGGNSTNALVFILKEDTIKVGLNQTWETIESPSITDLFFKLSELHMDGVGVALRREKHLKSAVNLFNKLPKI